MFCPNCGTQNPDPAQTCSKCNFHLKGAAAPKFKGTMLMMNQAVAPAPTPAVPAPMRARRSPRRRPGAPVGGPPPPACPEVPAECRASLKGTMVGVAPMAGGAASAPRSRGRRSARP